MNQKQIDQAIENWHNGAGEGLALHEYLGMTFEAWKIYITNLGEFTPEEASQLAESLHEPKPSKDTQ